MSDEVWKPLPEFEDCYEVSDAGRVRSLDHVSVHTRGEQRIARKVKGRVLKPGIASNGYPTVNIHGRHTRGNKCVHVLVLRTFLGPPPENHICLHKTPDRLNCRLDNLYYGTYKQNMEDCVRDNGFDSQHYKERYAKNIDSHRNGNKKVRHLTPDDVKDIRAMLAAGKSNNSIAKLYGADASAIRAIKVGRTYKDF